jgi:hypothetical protein
MKIDNCEKSGKKGREMWGVLPRNTQEHSSHLSRSAAYGCVVFRKRGVERRRLKINVQTRRTRWTWFESTWVLIPVVQCRTGYWGTDVMFYFACERQFRDRDNRKVCRAISDV